MIPASINVCQTTGSTNENTSEKEDIEDLYGSLVECSDVRNAWRDEGGTTNINKIRVLKMQNNYPRYIELSNVSAYTGSDDELEDDIASDADDDDDSECLAVYFPEYKQKNVEEYDNKGNKEKEMYGRLSTHSEMKSNLKIDRKPFSLEYWKLKALKCNDGKENDSKKRMRNLSEDRLVLETSGSKLHGMSKSSNGCVNEEKKVDTDGSRLLEVNDNDDISPAFGILSVYCNSELHSC